MKNTWTKRLGLLLLGLVVSGVWWHASQTEAAAGVNGVHKRTAGLEGLVEFARASLQDSYHISIRWNGELERGTAEELATRLENDFDSRITASASEHGGIYRELADKGGKGVQGSLSLLEGEPVQISLLLEAPAAQADSLAEVRSRIDEWLDERGSDGAWSVKMEGTWGIGANQSADTDSGEQLEIIQHQVVSMAGKVLGAERADSYHEGSLAHDTYRSARLPFEAAGAEGIKLQTAVRQDTETGEWKVAVGAPMLSGEF